MPGAKFVRLDEVLGKELQDPSFAQHFHERRMIHEVALAVRRMRRERGLTQARLAKMIGSTQPAIARLEKGLDQRAPRWDTLYRIGLALGRQLVLRFAPDHPNARRAAARKAPLVEVRGLAARRPPAKSEVR